MASIAPTALVAAPPRLPLPFGAFSVMSFRENGDRWFNGVSWETLTCEPAGVYGPPDCVTQSVTGVATVVDLTITGTPTSGTFQITDGTLTSGAIAFDADVAAVETAMAAFDVTAVEGPLPAASIQVTYAETGVTPALSVTGSTLDVGEASVSVVTEGGDEVEGVTGLPRSLDTQDAPLGAALPFSVYGHHLCSPVGNTLEWAQSKAREHLDVREEAAVETAVQSIITTKGSVLTGTTAAWETLAALEQHFAETYGGQGVIWTSRRLATLMGDDGDLSRSGGRLTTPLGTPVVAATGVEDGFIAITSQPVAYRSGIEDFSERPYDLLDRNLNNLLAIAERTYVVGFDDCGMTYAQLELPAVTITSPTAE